MTILGIATLKEQPPCSQTGGAALQAEIQQPQKSEKGLKCTPAAGRTELCVYNCYLPIFGECIMYEWLEARNHEGKCSEGLVQKETCTENMMETYLKQSPWIKGLQNRTSNIWRQELNEKSTFPRKV